MDLGNPASYVVLAEGTPVLSFDGEEIGTVEHVLTLDAEAADRLPEPAAVEWTGPEETVPDEMGDKLRRAWDYLSGKY